MGGGGGSEGERFARLEDAVVQEVDVEQPCRRVLAFDSGRVTWTVEPREGGRDAGREGGGESARERERGRGGKRYGGENHLHGMGGRVYGREDMGGSSPGASTPGPPRSRGPHTYVWVKGERERARGRERERERETTGYEPLELIRS